MDLNAAILKLNAIKETTKACKGKIELIGLDDNSVTLKFIDDNAKESFHHKKIIGFCPAKS